MATDARAASADLLVHRSGGAAREGRLPFWGLMLFTFILFVTPQAYLPVLHTLRIAFISAGIALGAYVLDRLSRGRPLTLTPPPVKLLMVFMVLAAASIPLSRWPGGAFDAFFNELLKSFLIFLLVANVVNTLSRMKLLIGSLAAWTILMSFTAVRDFSEGNLALGQGTRIYGYDSPLAANPNDLALILNIVLALLVGLYDGARRGIQRWCLLVCMGLSISAIVVSFSRGGFLTLAAIGVTVLIKRMRERGPMAIAWPLLAMLFILPLLPAGYFERVYTIFNSEADATGSSDARWASMVLAWNAIRDHPFLGVGLQMHGLDFLDTLNSWNWTGVHNVYLQIGADLGVPAMVVYLLTIWHLFRGIGGPLARLRRRPEAQELVAIGAGIRIALIAFCVGAFFHPVAYHFYFFYIAGLAVGCSELAKRFDAPTPDRRNGGSPLPREEDMDRPSARRAWALPG